MTNIEKNLKLIETAITPYFQSELFCRHTGKIQITLDMNEGGIANTEVITKKSYKRKN